MKGIPMFWQLFEILPKPSPQLSPLEVVKIQLDALQNNDLMPNDEGIRFAFRYTSPMNREALGSLEEFIELLKHQAYRQIIGFERAELDKMYVDGLIARQDVHLIRRDDMVSYFFMLSRQQQEPFSDCWMTDAVLPKK
jgi:hypothetical protein